MRSQVRFVLIFVSACIGAIYLQEIGHAVLGWIQGIGVVPTPAKEYVLRTEIEWHQEIWIALGGVLATVLVTTAATFWYWRRSSPTSAAMLSGVLVTPGFYTLRFVLAGRGHDGLEWQEAQGALGLSPSGHVIDWILTLLFVLGCAALWLRKAIPMRWRSLAQVLGVALLGFAMLVLVQVGNNELFNRHFPATRVLNIPADLEPKSTAP